jgi:leucyl aminopeptidase
MAKSTHRRAAKVNTTAKATAKATTKAANKAANKAKTSATALKQNDRVSKGQEWLGLRLKTWIETARKPTGAEARSGKRGFVIALASRDPKALKAALNGHLSKWQMDLLLASDADSQLFHGEQGPVWVLRSIGAEASNNPLAKSGFARWRDLAGAVVSQLAPFKLEKLVCELQGLGTDEELGFLVGLEMATYSYTEARANTRKTPKPLPALLVKNALTPTTIESAARLAWSVNAARHLTNIPGGELYPETYAQAAKELFASSETVEVDVWEGEKLLAERMNLLVAVGQGAAHGPRLVHLRYRPKNGTEGKKPIAIVGKGVTFDSGGLDIKPSSGMRWMKKDMGGSAAALAIAKWAEMTALDLPLDIYLSLAENSVSGNSMRPGDVIVARNGLSIEIHNTDAEGRLVMADAFDVAVTQEGENAPAALINLATLTGAIKVGLGAEIAGLFSNNDELATQLTTAGTDRGDLMWRMPLYQPYKSSLRSNFADYTNCSDGGFGGAITAALFLELFVKSVPWAHLDVYAWKDSAGGAWAETGASGQPVLALTETLARLATSR